MSLQSKFRADAVPVHVFYLFMPNVHFLFSITNNIVNVHISLGEATLIHDNLS